MRIATFNVENLAIRARHGARIEERERILRPQLERMRADILCLQEVAGEREPGASERSLPALRHLLSGTSYESFHVAARGGQGGTGVADVHNLVVASRFPIKSHRAIRHESVPPFSYRLRTACPPEDAARRVEFDRPILVTEIELASGPLHVINVHLRAPLASTVTGQKEAPFVWKSVSGWAEGYFLSAMKRTGQALELRFAVDDILEIDEQAMIAVCGDFNAEDHETPLRLVTGAEDDTGNGRLAARSLVIVDRAIPHDRRFSVLHHGRPQMLDHVLASRSLMARFRGVECQNEALEDDVVGYAKVQHSTASYHAPLVAEFGFE